jgi:hypothetical protein
MIRHEFICSRYGPVYPGLHFKWSHAAAITGFPRRIALSYRRHGRIGAFIRSGCLVNTSWVIGDGQDFIDVRIRPFRQGGTVPKDKRGFTLR